MARRVSTMIEEFIVSANGQTFTDNESYVEWLRRALINFAEEIQS